MSTGCADFLLSQMAGNAKKSALVSNEGTTTYGELLEQIAQASETLSQAGVMAGQSVQLRGDFNTVSVAYLLALLNLGTIVSPVAPTSFEKATEFADVADVSWIVDGFSGSISKASRDSKHPLYDRLRKTNDAGIIIFSSGTSGVSKGALHSAEHLLSKFKTPGKDFVTLAFLLFDHIAGFDTLMYCLSNCSTLVCPTERSAVSICELIQTHNVEVLPTAPSFLNLMLLSGAHENFDLSSLKIITYGAEMMPQPLLERVAGAMPKARLVQKYGTSEIGALRSQSENSTSRWLRIGKEGKDWRIVDGLLEIKTKTAMLGYLNAPSPFTKDGFYKTGDRVELRGDMIRFEGRDSDIINVGGQKVFPAEVEAELRELDGILDAAVYGAPHPILGASVGATIQVVDDATSPADLRIHIRKGLAGKLEPYKIPQKIKLTTDALVTDRFKQKRQ